MSGSSALTEFYTLAENVLNVADVTSMPGSYDWLCVCGCVRNVFDGLERVDVCAYGLMVDVRTVCFECHGSVLSV